MILDSSCTLDNNVAITASRPSTNVIDINNARDLGAGSRNLWLFVNVTTALAGPAGTTFQVQWQGSPDNVTWTTMVETPAYPATAVPAGRRFLSMTVPIQDNPSVNIPGSAFRYFRLNYVVGGGPLTAGVMWAGLVLDRQDAHQYPKNFTVQA